MTVPENDSRGEARGGGGGGGGEGGGGGVGANVYGFTSFTGGSQTGLGVEGGGAGVGTNVHGFAAGAAAGGSAKAPPIRSEDTCIAIVLVPQIRGRGLKLLLSMRP